MRRYALFLGCLIPMRLPFLETSSRLVLDALKVPYDVLEGASCCPNPASVQSVSFKAWLYLAARNLALAEEEKKDILVLCNGCFETLKSTREILLRSPELMEEVNEALKLVDREFKGDSDVVHFVDVVYGIGPSMIRDMVVRELKVNAAVQYGCHLLRPSEDLKFDDPKNPRKLDELVEALGARSVDYEYKHLCCGMSMNSVKRELSNQYVRWKLKYMVRAGARCVVVACPSCFMQYDIGQVELKRRGELFNLPVFYYAEMLGLALGYGYRELGLHMHKTSAVPLLEELFFRSSH